MCRSWLHAVLWGWVSTHANTEVLFLFCFGPSRYGLLYYLHLYYLVRAMMLYNADTEFLFLLCLNVHLYTTRESLYNTASCLYCRVCKWCLPAASFLCYLMVAFLVLANWFSCGRWKDIPEISHKISIFFIKKI